MGEEAIPDDVARFIVTAIDSVPHLEAILLLRTDAQKEWTGADVAGRLYVSETCAQSLLEDLASRGLLSAGQREGARTFCFRPAAPGAIEILDRLAAVYAKNLIGVTNLIHSKAAAGARAFADAFRFRKEH